MQPASNLDRQKEEMPHTDALTQFNPNLACGNKSLVFITVKNHFLFVSLV